VTLARPLGGVILSAVGVAWAISLVSGYDIVSDVDPARASLLPGGGHLLGTDHLGRDVAWRLLTASEAFVGPAIAASALATAISVPAGALAGWAGGATARVLRYGSAVIAAVPRFVLVLLICAAYGDHPLILAAAAGLAYAPTMSEAIYHRTRALARAEFIVAGRSHGLSDARLLLYHLLWVNGRPVVWRHLAHLFAYVLLLETTLSYLGGFGVEEPQPSWGNMLAFSFADTANPWAWLAPALCLWGTLFGLTLLSHPTPARTRRSRPRTTPTPGSEPGLHVRGLTVKAGDAVLLSGVTFSLLPGEIVALVGSSGAGKSLTARACLGLLDLEPGQVAGEIVVNTDRLGYLSQDAQAALDPVWTVGRQLAEIIRLQDQDPTPEALDGWLRLVGFPAPERIRPLHPHELSGGMAQRVCAALLLARGCRFLLLDEPTSSLDPSVAHGLLAELGRLKAAGVGVLLITHDLRLVPQHADRVLVMAGGRIVEEAAASALDDASAPETRALLEATARIGAGLLPGGQDTGTRRPVSHEPLLRIRGLIHHYRTGLLQQPATHPAVDQVDMGVSAGEVVGLIGESGAGKSTLARIAAGLCPPDQGIVDLGGRPMYGPQDRRRDVQLLFQSALAHLNPGLTLSEMLAESARIHRPGTSPEETVREVLAAVSLSDRADALAGALSGGEQRRAGLAQLLLTQPRLVVADEPTVGLDAAMKAALLDRLLSMRTPQTGILIVSHDLPMISYAADRVMVMIAGRIVESFPTSALRSGPHHPYTWSLLSAAGLPVPAELPPSAPPSAQRTPRGCPHQESCALASPACVGIRPLFIEVGRAHKIACHAPEARQCSA